jgi:hypothetical protein
VEAAQQVFRADGNGHANGRITHGLGYLDKAKAGAVVVEEVGK